jgi:hypothetical protein
MISKKGLLITVGCVLALTKELRNAFEDIKQSSGGLSLLANDLNTTVGWFKV